MGRSTAPGSRPATRTAGRRPARGYVLIMLMVVVFALSVGALIALPVWQTQVQREKEAELIFRGKQYVEAVRLYQQKYPGSFPQSFEELVEEKCIRRLYKDPMTKDGLWNVVLQAPGLEEVEEGNAPQKVLIAPSSALTAIDLPAILGVVSASTQKSVRVYNKQTTYDKWLFYYGQDPEKLPQIVIYGQEEKKNRD
jgi:type II secretory pathway pseudopilin PulG